MIVRSKLILFFVFLLLIETLNAFNPAYYRKYIEEQQLNSFINALNHQSNDQQTDLTSSENNDDDEDQLNKRNKYTNFHLSPLWLSRRTRTNRFYGKPIWISRNG